MFKGEWCPSSYFACRLKQSAFGSQLKAPLFYLPRVDGRMQGGLAGRMKGIHVGDSSGQQTVPVGFCGRSRRFFPRDMVFLKNSPAGADLLTQNRQYRFSDSEGASTRERSVKKQRSGREKR